MYWQDRLRQSRTFRYWTFRSRLTFQMGALGDYTGAQPSCAPASNTALAHENHVSLYRLYYGWSYSPALLPQDRPSDFLGIWKHDGNHVLAGHVVGHPNDHTGLFSRSPRPEVAAPFRLFQQPALSCCGVDISKLSFSA